MLSLLMPTATPAEQSDLSSLPRTAPRDCALLVGIPANLTAFLEDVDKNEDSYASFVVSRNRLADCEWLFEQLKQRFQLMDQVCREVEDLGVAVYREATLDNLSEALKKRTAIALLSHSYVAPFQAEQILDAERVTRTLNDRTTVAKNSLPSPRADGPTACRQLADLLQKLVTPFPTRAAFDRGFLEDLLGDAVTTARFVELRDGIHSVNAIIDRVPMEFEGIFDLSMCRDTLLGGALKRHRPRCAVIKYPVTGHGARQRTHTRHRLIRYKLLIHVLQHYAQPYGPALQSLVYP